MTQHLISFPKTVASPVEGLSSELIIFNRDVLPDPLDQQFQ